jgi:glyoxylase-like metal-dependent hydrolase (beta-lactamase superfamily II)
MTYPMPRHTALPGECHVEPRFDPATGTVSYLVVDRHTRACALIDTVLGYSASSGRTDHAAADALIARVRTLDARLDWILETHVHADHLSAAYIQDKLGGRTGIGARIAQVQATFAQLFNLGRDVATDGSQFGCLFEDGDTIPLGRLTLTVLHTPGHTPACVSYVVDSTPRAAFVGDTLFMPDFGTARCDFPGGDARQLYRSIRKVLALPDDTVLYTGHDYQPGGRAPRFSTTVAGQRAHNLHMGGDVSEDAFVAMRSARDESLALTVLMLPSVQVNIRGGRLPQREANGVATSAAAGTLDWTVALPFAAGAVAGMLGGRMLAGRANGTLQQRSFGWVALAIAVALAVKAIH